MIHDLALIAVAWTAVSIPSALVVGAWLRRELELYGPPTHATAPPQEQP